MHEELGELKRFLLEKRTVEEIQGLLEANNIAAHSSSTGYELWVYECQVERTEDVLDAQHLMSYSVYASD